MKQMYHVIMTLAVSLLIFACEKEEVVDTFPQDLTKTEWCIASLSEGEMFVYSFIATGTSGYGYKYKCYGNGRIVETFPFHWTYNSKTAQLSLLLNDSNLGEDYAIVSHDEGNIIFEDGTIWRSYFMQSDSYDLQYGSPIPDDLFEHPEWYDFEGIYRWELNNNKWLMQDSAYIHKDKGLLAIKGEENIIECKYKKNFTFDMGGYTWRLDEGCDVRNSANENWILSISKPIIELEDEQAVPDFVIAEPEAYGFQYKKCWVQHYHLELKYYLLFDESAIYYNDKGAFITPWYTDINCYIYNTWRTDRNWFGGEEGIWRPGNNAKYFIYGSISDGTKYQSTVTFDPPTLERVHFTEQSYTINSFASGYSQAENVNVTGAYFFDVYDPEFSISKVTVSYSHSWLWTAKLTNLAPERFNTRVKLLWANSANYGSTRTGYIYITVHNIKGESYSHTLTVTQYGPNGSGGGGGGGNDEDTLGPEWVKGTAHGYAPYYYCSNTGRTTPANPVSTSITIYRNSNTGAYKAAYAGKLYNAQKGYNKITMESEAHSIYDSTYKYWKTCIDKRYLEFTIY
jgi:hypothetical protein